MRQQLTLDNKEDSALAHHVVKLVTVMALSQDLGDFDKHFQRVFVAKEAGALTLGGIGRNNAGRLFN